MHRGLTSYTWDYEKMLVVAHFAVPGSFRPFLNLRIFVYILISSLYIAFSFTLIITYIFIR